MQRGQPGRLVHKAFKVPVVLQAQLVHRVRRGLQVLPVLKDLRADRELQVLLGRRVMSAPKARLVRTVLQDPKVFKAL